MITKHVYINIYDSMICILLVASDNGESISIGQENDD